MNGLELYRLARDSGWKIEYTRRMKGMSITLQDPAQPDKRAGAFGYAGIYAGDRTGEPAAWDALAEEWNEDRFWFVPPD